MTKKPYVIDAVVGNGKMLASLMKTGRMVRLWWPRVDFPQHVDEILVGLFTPGTGKQVQWTHEGAWTHQQQYVEDTAILVTRANHPDGWEVVGEDIAAVGEEVLVRRYTVTNTGEKRRPVQFFQYSSMPMAEHPHYQTVAFDRRADALVHFRHEYACAIGADRACAGFQAGDARRQAEQGRLGGNDIEMEANGALMWDLGELNPGEGVSLTLYYAFGNGPEAAVSTLAYARDTGADVLREQTVRFWTDYLAQARPVATGRPEWDRLYRRSLIVFKLMSDPDYGSLIAAPEFDEGFTRCGGYAYCWGRDAAYITTAIDRAGYHGMARRFYRWAANAQSADGSWEQRHYLDGRVAPHWGLQIDETGSILWGMWQHYRETGEDAFLIEMWPTIRKGEDFLVGFIDPETGLPLPSRDLWEERNGEHTYSAAAVYGGLNGAAAAARQLGHQAKAQSWGQAAEALQKACDRQLWNPERGSFLRGLKLAVTDKEFVSAQNRGDRVVVETDSKGHPTHRVWEDAVIDISLLGVNVPFELFDIHDKRVQQTAQAVENALGGSPAGGILRYEDDPYIGGNPWILTTLWLALYKIKAGDREGAETLLEWAVHHRTELDLLPEQIDRNTGEAAWVVPLTWSHAMLVLAVLDWMEAGKGNESASLEVVE